MSKKITKREAEALWSSLHDYLADAEKIIVKIVQTEAWKPLGYATLSEAWEDRLKGVRLATAMSKAHVVYTMLAEDKGLEEVVELLGISESVVKAIAESKAKGVPPELARTQARPDATRVRTHERSKPGAACTVHIKFDYEDYLNLKDTAEALSVDLEHEARTAVKAHFARLRRHAKERVA